MYANLTVAIKLALYLYNGLKGYTQMYKILNIVYHKLFVAQNFQNKKSRYVIIQTFTFILIYFVSVGVHRPSRIVPSDFFVSSANRNDNSDLDLGFCGDPIERSM